LSFSLAGNLKRVTFILSCYPETGNPLVGLEKMNSTNIKIPHFLDQPPISDINNVIAHLVVFPSNDQVYQSGSCCRIAKNMYLTASHVVKDWIKKYGNTTNGQDIQIWAIHVSEGPVYSIWEADCIFFNPLSDMAIIHTRPYNKEAVSEASVACVAIQLLPPAVGDTIFGFGHYKPNQNITFSKDGTRHIEINSIGASTVGVVKEVHNNRRDSIRLNFPCFQVNARFDGGMSGGPVFNKAGQLCGIICSNLPPTEDGDEHVSYATTLWPLMATFLSISEDGNKTEKSYPLLELAERKVIKAIGYEHVKITGTIETRDLNVSLKL
jgi:hypothetical protein